MQIHLGVMVVAGVQTPVPVARVDAILVQKHVDQVVEVAQIVQVNAEIHVAKDVHQIVVVDVETLVVKGVPDTAMAPAPEHVPGDAVADVIHVEVPALITVAADVAVHAQVAHMDVHIIAQAAVIQHVQDTVIQRVVEHVADSAMAVVLAVGVMVNVLLAVILSALIVVILRALIVPTLKRKEI